MYVGYCDSQVLFTNSRPEDYAITAGIIDYQENAAAAFNFTLPPTNAARGLIIPKASVISVERDGSEVYRGVVDEYTIDKYGNYVCASTDLLACLNNILKDPFRVTAMAISKYVSAILKNYNDAVTADKRIELGDVTVSGTITLNHHEDYATIFDLFKELIAEKGGLLRLRYSGGKVYLDYLKENSAINMQDIVFGKNLLDISSQIDSSTLVSRVYPVGTGGVTIAAVNNGKPYLINEAVEAQYGRIDKTISVNSDDPNEIKSVGQAYLTRYAALQNTFTLTAIDRSRYDKTLTPFCIGDSILTISPPHGIDAYMPVSKMALDIIQDGNSRLTSSRKSKALTGIIQNK